MRGARPALTSAVMLAIAGAAHAQDSVANTPGQGDALLPYDNHALRYVVDLAPIASSWGNTFLIAPIAKASASPADDTTTLLAGSAALSPDARAAIAFPLTEFAEWSAAGPGVNPLKNSAPGGIEITGYDRQLGLALTSLSGGPTDAIGALIGQNNTELTRLFVTRTTAAASRPDAASRDTATLASSAIDADGNTLLRFDAFNITLLPRAARGDSIASIALGARNPAATNHLTGDASGAQATDPTATAFPIDQSATTTNLPALLPASLSGSGDALGVIFDFAGRYLANGSSPTTAHLPASITAHRGNPALSTITPLGGVATVGALGRSASGQTDSLFAFAIDGSGTVVNATPVGGALPSPITTDDGFSTNQAGDAQFLHYLSQAGFRGPAAHAAIGRDGPTGPLLLAATATDPTDGDFIAVATFAGGSPSWTIAAHIGQPVLDGPNGNAIGQLIAQPPASISTPALDLMGNAYFVARYQPDGGEPTTALFKSVNTASGYQIELVLAVGATVTGVNSQTPYTIDRLTLADADSVAPGAFNSAMLHQLPIPGNEPTDAIDPFAMGGAVVNARITYDSMGVGEAYDCVLYVGPGARVVLPDCPGDLNGDNEVNSSDLNILLAAFATTSAGDIDGDGDTDSGDLNLLLAAFANDCP